MDTSRILFGNEFDTSRIQSGVGTGFDSDSGWIRIVLIQDLSGELIGVVFDSSCIRTGCD